MELNKKNYPNIYFFCCDEPDNLQDDIICLAEGLKKMDIPFYSNANYWLQSPSPDDFLFKSTPEVNFQECDIIIFGYTWFNWVKLDQPTKRRDIPEGLFQNNRKYKIIYMDTNDGYRTVAFENIFRKFDFIFRTKFNKNCYHPSNFLPWQLGLSNRILEATSNNRSFDARKNEILWNFGASHPYPHGLRKIAATKFQPKINKILDLNTITDNLQIAPSEPYERLMWLQTNGRHSASYYSRLKDAKACAAFCGELIPPKPFDPTPILVGGKKATLKRNFYKALSLFENKSYRNIQWDSWRFWESLATGTVPIHVDLEKYGVALPIMPENWKHYIGIDLDSIDAAIDRIRSEPDIFKRISLEGYKWVMEYYSPKPVAKRFLQILGYPVTENKNE